jgi:hypothetical protein
VAAKHEDIRRTHQLFDPLVRNPSDQVYAVAEARIAVDAPLYDRQQRCGSKTAPKLQFRQPSNGLTDSVEYRNGVLVRVQMTNPQQARITFQTGSAPRLGLIPRCKATGAFRNLIHLRLRLYKASAHKGPRLLA